MQLIRIIGNYYHKGKRRFTHRCFRIYKDGISVISKDCIESKYKNTICKHINDFYSKPAGFPIVFWCFDSKILGDAAILENKKSDSGDACHYNIIGISNEKAKEIYQSQEKNGNLNLKFCRNMKEKKLIMDQYHDLLLNKKL